MARGRQKAAAANGKNGKHGNGGQLGFEAELFLAADKLRKNLEPSDYKHVVLGLIFLRHISLGHRQVNRLWQSGRRRARLEA